jgi:hypothetical protein
LLLFAADKKQEEVLQTFVDAAKSSLLESLSGFIPKQ